MIQITLQALTKILLSNGHTFTLEPCDLWEDDKVIRFVVSHNYPLNSQYVMSGKFIDTENASEDRRSHKAKVVLHYCLDKQTVIAINPEWRELIINEKAKAKERNVCIK